jgi:hypothetical protein
VNINLHLKRKTLIVLLIVLVIPGITAGGYFWYQHKIAEKSVELSESIKDDLAFKVLYPKSAEKLTVDTHNTAYYAKEKLFVFKAYHKDALTELTFSQQVAADNVKQGSTELNDLITSMKPYANFNTIYGKVTMTRPTNQGGRQTGVLVAGGDMIFVRAKEDMTEDQWHQLFTNLVWVDKINK